MTDYFIFGGTVVKVNLATGEILEEFSYPET